MEKERYEAVFGFNTKQWWIYDSETDEYCDPPVSFLDKVKKVSDNIDEQEKELYRLLETDNDWLDDEDYRYDAEETDI